MKMILILGFAVLSVFFNNSVLAKSYEYEPYLGLDLHWHNMNNKNINTEVEGIRTNTPSPRSANPGLSNVPVLNGNNGIHANVPRGTAPNTLVLPKSNKYGSPILNIYTGVKFNKGFGIETGYTGNLSKRYLGFRFRRSSLHASFLTYLPLANSIEFISGFGFSCLNHVVAPIDNLKFDHLTQRHSVLKIVPRALIGFQIEASEKLLLRGSLVWESSKRMRNNGILFHDSTHFGLGFQYKLS